MKLASLKSKSKDGELCVVSDDLTQAVRASHIAPSLRDALENWTHTSVQLHDLATALDQKKAKGAFEFKQEKFESALPRTFLFADGSAFLHHIKLVRKARNAALPETLTTVPLMYQGEGARFLAPNESIPQKDFSHGTDLEAEVGVITDFVPMGTTPADALNKIRLIVLINDVSLRGLIPAELASGFGFFQSKPAKALSPLALTPDEFGAAWQDGRLHLPMHVKINGEFFGKANAGAMHFNFGDLISFAARTRDLQAGTVIGSGTVSNDAKDCGSSCLVEKRTIEQIETGKPVTEYLKRDDVVEIWMEDENRKSLFGKIKQKVVQV